MRRTSLNRKIRCGGSREKEEVVGVPADAPLKLSRWALKLTQGRLSEDT